MTERTQYARYIALGDSISIDLYPAEDLRARGREVLSYSIGAASLFHKNQDWLWPEFAGRDLVSLTPGIEFHDLTSDGATTETVLNDQLRRLPGDSHGSVLVTLTVGGNDLLLMIGEEPTRAAAELGESISRVRAIVEHVRASFSDVLLLIGTVYDPSDGLNHLGDGVVLDQMPGLLVRCNDELRQIAASFPVCRLTDIHAHFLTHGLSEPDPAERWYLERNIIEPSARGASEVRSLWLECIQR